MYIPPFSISAEAINLIAQISAQVERYAIKLEREDGLHLRKANRIKTIHSSLAIEGNTLTEDQVRDVINGQNIIAPIREIQEVKNAIKTYELYSQLDPFKVSDLLKAHESMMTNLVDEPGQFRKKGVGVFGDKGCVHVAPPAELVPTQIKELFEWLKKAKDHLLVKSCVFHYEFEFIHPFTDGNGRMGRLWQSLILGKLNPIFEFLPIENMVYQNQQAYYNAIADSTKNANSGPFIDFMLEEILKALKAHQGIEFANVGTNVGTNVGANVGTNVGTNEKKILTLIAHNNRVTAQGLSEQTGITKRQCERILAALKANGTIVRIGSTKSGHWEINTDKSTLGE